MIQLSWGERPVDNYLALLNGVPENELDSPRRSVVPLVDFWRTPEKRVHELGELIGLPLHPPAKLVFEYAVEVQSGRGKASFTDLMILTGDTAVAIEAKYTEPEYENVRAWLRDPVEDNRTKVLNG